MLDQGVHQLHGVVILDYGEHELHGQSSLGSAAGRFRRGQTVAAPVKRPPLFVNWLFAPHTPFPRSHPLRRAACAFSRARARRSTPGSISAGSHWLKERRSVLPGPPKANPGAKLTPSSLAVTRSSAASISSL